MNTVLDPSMLFISESDWDIQEKQDEFLNHLLDNLNSIDEYGLTKIYWTDELEELLWCSPNLPPWRVDRDFRNQIVQSISKLFVKNQILIKYTEKFIPCYIEPPMNWSHGKREVNNDFLKLMHHVIHRHEGIYLCVGIENKLSGSERYTFSCFCGCRNEECIPELVNCPSDWEKHFDIEKNLWGNPEGLRKAIEKTAIERFPDRFKKGFIYNYEFSEEFMGDIIEEKLHRKQILFNVAKRLLFKRNEASTDKGLNDELVKGNEKERRFRVTGENRIHYTYNDENDIVFLRYYREGQHDDGLK